MTVVTHMSNDHASLLMKEWNFDFNFCGCDYIQVPNLSYSNGKNYKGPLHILPHLPHPFIFFSRYHYSLSSPLHHHFVLYWYSSMVGPKSHICTHMMILTYLR